MIDINTLLPEVKKLLPGVSDEEIIAGIKEFAQTHPDLSNEEALQALSMYLKEQNQPQAEAAPSAPPFQNLMNSLGAH